MTFEVRNQLMQMVQNDAIAYRIAFEFVTDDMNKLSVFQRAYSESQHGTVESRAAAAKDVATKRWETMYPPEAAAK